MSDAAVSVQDLRVAFGPTLAVDGLSLEAERGAITAVLGPNGAGKTTTLAVIEGQRRPDAGVVRVLGHEPDRDAAVLRPRVGVMLQSGGLHPGASARELLEHTAALYARPHDPAALAALLGLDGLGRTPVRRLSGGEQRRLAFALAIIGRPELLVLDEPTTGLDPQARLVVWETVEQLRTAGVSVLLTTHLLEEAERVADHVVIIDHGRAVASGSVAALTGGGAAYLTVTTDPGLPVEDLQRRLPPGATVTEESPGRYRAAGDLDASAAAAAAAWCADHGCTPSELAVRTPSLEDVFLDLTGRELRP